MAHISLVLGFLLLIIPGLLYLYSFRFPIREEFADRLENPDPVPLTLLAGALADPLGEQVRNDDSGHGQNVVGVSDIRQKCGDRRGRESSPTVSAQSTDQVNPEAPRLDEKVS